MSRIAHRTHPRDAAAKNFWCALFCAEISAHCESAYEIWVFMTLFFPNVAALALALAQTATRGGACDDAGAIDFAPRKILCTGGLYGRADDLGEAQNARIGTK
jgi:hypothetical protein